jgi:hypothetical protein
MIEQSALTLSEHVGLPIEIKSGKDNWDWVTLWFDMLPFLGVSSSVTMDLGHVRLSEIEIWEGKGKFDESSIEGLPICESEFTKVSKLVKGIESWDDEERKNEEERR